MQDEELFKQVREEIKLIHSVYDSGNKSIKPSFRFIAVSLDTDNFIVAKTLDVIQEKAAEYGAKLCQIFDIFEVEEFSDKTYRAVVKYSYFPGKGIKEEHELRNCMHIAWRTRGDLLEVCY